MVFGSMDESSDKGAAAADAKRLRNMAQKVRRIAEQAVSERTRRVLRAMADEYDLHAAALDSQAAVESSSDSSS